MTPFSNMRGPQRRKDDFERDVSRWAMMFAVHRGKVITVFTVLTSVMTWMVTTAAYYAGARREIAKSKQDIAHLDSTVIVLRDRVQGYEVTLRDIRGDVKFLVYRQCLSTRADDKYATEKCLPSNGTP